MLTGASAHDVRERLPVGGFFYNSGCALLLVSRATIGLELYVNIVYVSSEVTYIGTYIVLNTHE